MVIIPINIDVTCNYSDALWKLYGTAPSFPVTIGGGANVGFLGLPYTTGAVTGTNAISPINGVGTTSTAASLSFYAAGVANKIWSGAGAISTSLPITLEF
jgi:hypothetical protein